ncbi:peptidoglycan-associated outer membrane lipoprotein precursor, partial [Xanthomonas oryzae pv. oryzae]
MTSPRPWPPFRTTRRDLMKTRL